ncbi:unnamed protein product [Echinostoma caproni]|uniref:FGFR1 oncogene partner 2-like n=1 Tax=Echinostoma caproni TaxID=27848 RepID=A0A183A5X8_9TREM|nr:unnamed protein product [Echinostoma caproni]
MAVDVDADLENVTRELRDLQVLVGRYDDCANELQTELKMANDEYFDLLNARSSKNSITKEAKRYRDELELAMKSQAANKREDQAEVHMRKCSDQPHASTKPGHQSGFGYSDEFTHQLLDVTFQLHEQLSHSHSRRHREHKEMDRFVDNLNNMYRQSIAQLREQQRKDLQTLSGTLQRSAQNHLGILVREQQKLKARLLRAEETEKESKILIQDLKNQLSDAMRNAMRNSCIIAITFELIKVVHTSS